MALAVVTALVLAGSCIPTDPVREGLQIVFLDEGVVSISVRVTIESGEKEGALKDRLADVRQSYLQQSDPWSRRFQRTQAKYDRFCVERKDGGLTAVERTVVVEPDKITDVFYDTGIQVFYREQAGIAELTIYSGGSQRATREQQQDYRQSVVGWGSDLAAYGQAMERVYAYMDAQPARATILFADLLGEKRSDGEEQPTDDERELLSVAHKSMDAVARLFETGEARAYSLNELSSLVNDPFPASVTISPNGRLLEREGFELEKGGAQLRVPRVDLWSAVKSMEGQWLSPDPLAALVAHAIDDSVAVPSAAQMASLSRRATPPPDGEAVWTELSKRMTVPHTLRATWVVKHPAAQ